MVVVPTQLTADGIASPVSVIRDDAGRLHSGHGRLPIAVAVDLEVIAGARRRRARARASATCSPIPARCATGGWRAGRAARRWTTSPRFWRRAATDLVYGLPPPGSADGSPDAAFLQRLLRGLVLSGLAMEIAGSSRPCSGSEHLISHALDALHPGTAQHGEQVAFGALLATRLQGGDWRALRSFMVAAGMHDAAGGLRPLGVDELAAVVRAAPVDAPGPIHRACGPRGPRARQRCAAALADVRYSPRTLITSRLRRPPSNSA